MNQDVDELIDWFSGRQLPEGPFRISEFEWTNDLNKAVPPAIDSALQGHHASIRLLQRIREALSLAR